jgi:hypothetical protein
MTTKIAEYFRAPPEGGNYRVVAARSSSSKNPQLPQQQ